MQPRFAISNIFLISLRVNVSLKVEVISKNQTIITISSQKTLKINYCHCQTRANAEDMIQYEIRKSIWNYINLHKILKIIFVQFKVSVWSIRKGREKSLQWKFPFEGGLEDDRNDARRLVSQTPSPQEKNLPLKRSLPSLFPAKGSKRGGKSKGEGGGGKRERYNGSTVICGGRKVDSGGENGTAFRPAKMSSKSGMAGGTGVAKRGRLPYR